MSLFFNSLRPSVFPAAYLYTEHSQAFNVSGDKKSTVFFFLKTVLYPAEFYLECFTTSPGCVELPPESVLPG